MTIKLPPVPKKRAAANQRSPNRKPRYRQLMRLSGKVAQQERFLRALEQGLSPKEIKERMALESQVSHWREKDSQFKAEMDAILARRKEIAETLRVPAVEDVVVEKALEGDMKAAIPYLEARAPELYGKKRVEHSGELLLGVKDIILDDSD